MVSCSSGTYSCRLSSSSLQCNQALLKAANLVQPLTVVQPEPLYSGCTPVGGIFWGKLQTPENAGLLVKVSLPAHHVTKAMFCTEVQHRAIPLCSLALAHNQGPDGVTMLALIGRIAHTDKRARALSMLDAITLVLKW